jgi:replicative DNA helicase
MSDQKTTNTIEKIPPHNIEAEQSVLGSLLIDKETIIRVGDIISPDDFYKSSHKTIYETMVELFEKREPIDLLTLTSRLEEKKQLEQVGGRSYLASLTTLVPTAANVVHYAHVIQKKATLYRLIRAATQIAEMGYDEKRDIEELLDEAESKLFGVSQNFLRADFTSINNLLTEAFDRIDELHRQKGKMRGIPTGFRDLDNMLAGFQKSNLVIIAARPSVGKTSLALDIVRQMAVKSRASIGLFSLEMSKEELVDRMLCAQANVGLWEMRTGRLSDQPDYSGESDFSRIGHGMGALAEAPVYIDDSGFINVMQIRTKARKLMSEHGLSAIFIDYLQLMEAHATFESRTQEVSKMTRQLKGLARELNIPVVALSQLSRQVEQRSPAIPKLSDLRESGSIEQDADVVMFIYRKSADRTLRNVSDEEQNMAEIHIAKHRNGPTGVVNLFWNAKCASFNDLAKATHHGPEPEAPPIPAETNLTPPPPEAAPSPAPEEESGELPEGMPSPNF